MKSYAVIELEKPFLWLRFGNIGNYAKFSALLSNFQCAFPLASWDDERKSWLLSNEEFVNILNFCKKHKLSPIIKHSNNTTDKGQGQQIVLPLG